MGAMCWVRCGHVLVRVCGPCVGEVWAHVLVRCGPMCW